MGKQFESLTDDHIEFIESQKLFFVGTAAADGLVNVSPKGMDSLRVLDESTVSWLNLTGSGNETAAHLRENNRMTILFCSFDKTPLILRVYGHASTLHPRDARWDTEIQRFPAYTGARQIFELNVDMVQTSCGFAVPYYEFTGERPTLKKWADNKTRAGVEDYWRERNTQSLDGRETGIVDER